MPRQGGIRLYRHFRCGNLVDFHVLDTRQYRDDQANGDGWKPPSRESADPNRTLLGAEQERWLLNGLEHSKAHWNVIAQQVFFSKKDVRIGPGELLSMDSWERTSLPTGSGFELHHRQGHIQSSGADRGRAFQLGQ